MEENMSLIEDGMLDCVLLERKRDPDGAGGFLPSVWVEGAPFKAMFETITSQETIVAEAKGMLRVYKVFVKKSLHLEHDDVFRRKEDGATFRVTGYLNDQKTPDISSLNLAVFTAERWELTQ
jgi:hypothetical protein